MTYVPITPFRRPVEAVHLSAVATADVSDRPDGVNKWEVLRELGVARKALGITDRALTVLQALLSFHPQTTLDAASGALIVFPSNASICDRLNGMPCSTMRRHLAALVNAGLVVRRDSPNGKRFSRQYSGEREAYGFDLSPLAIRFEEFCAMAETIRADEERHARLRRTVSLMARDLASLAVYGEEVRPDVALWSNASSTALSARAALRRNLAWEDLKELEASLATNLDACRDVLEGKTRNVSTNEAHSEQHIQNSNIDIHDPEPSLEKEEGDVEPRLPNVPLGLVLSVCEEFTAYVPDKVRHWHELFQAADRIRPMLGISPSAWSEAVEVMGPEEAAVVVLAMLERFDEIKSPGGYLRKLTMKSANDGFSCGPMIMALMRKRAA